MVVIPIIGIKYINPFESKPIIIEIPNKIEARKGLRCERENEYKHKLAAVKMAISCVKVCSVKKSPTDDRKMILLCLP